MGRILRGEVLIFFRGLVRFSSSAKLIGHAKMRGRSSCRSGPVGGDFTQFVGGLCASKRKFGALFFAGIHVEVNAPENDTQDGDVNAPFDDAAILDPESQKVELLRWRCSRRRGGRFCPGDNLRWCFGLRRFRHRAAESARRPTKGKRPPRDSFKWVIGSAGQMVTIGRKLPVSAGSVESVGFLEIEGKVTCRCRFAP